MPSALSLKRTCASAAQDSASADEGEGAVPFALVWVESAFAVWAAVLVVWRADSSSGRIVRFGVPTLQGSVGQ